MFTAPSRASHISTEDDWITANDSKWQIDIFNKEHMWDVRDKEPDRKTKPHFVEVSQYDQ